MNGRGNPDVIGFMFPSRLARIVRCGSAWLLWTETKDFIHGTYFMLYPNGVVERVTVREDEGDEHMQIRPTDEDA